VHGIRATPFRAFDPTTIPMRRSILRHYYLKFVSTTVAPGGVGKSTLCLLEAISIATGRNLTGTAPGERLKVWYINGEDPIDEIHRRVAAICIHHGIDQRELEGWLFLTSGRDMEIVLVEQARDGTKIHQHVVQQLKGTVRENDIAVVIFDPFVSCHRVSENDNNAMDRVVKLWAQIADQTGCAVELVHHARKTGGNDVTSSGL
jgi:RecA-family ATPase